LVRVVATDSNVLNVTFAAKCLEAFASGLRADFSQFASTVLGALLEKCKEKKKSVIDALVAAADAVIKTTSLEKVHVSWCSSSIFCFAEAALSSFGIPRFPLSCLLPVPSPFCRSLCVS
jgi:hypothetical protein